MQATAKAPASSTIERAGARLCRRLTLALLLVLSLSLCFGAVAMTPAQLWAGISGSDPALAAILLEIRLPRVLLGAVVGAALGLCGAALQGLLQNPLAEPGLLGVSAVASLGAVAALYFGLAAVSTLALPLSALAGALLATLLLLWLARRSGSLTLILSGVALGSLAVALTALAINLSPNPYASAELVFWLMGSLRDRGLDDLLLVLPFVATGALLLRGVGRGLDALTLGEDAGQSLGIDLARLRTRVVLAAALLAGGSVAGAGGVGFVGLVVPHLVRPFVAHRPGALLWPSALAGALLLASADLAVRLLPSGSELMLGVLTALIGAPFFLHLILQLGRQQQ
ncbi:MAG: iron ABC transporter permease [Alphaproteobacteria bacterium]|nr:iron ABC transporter permease [Alphaproteobacteria bacterium]